MPRSGTTLLGHYLGSSADAINLGEFGGFYVAHSAAPATLKVLPGYGHEEYLQEIQGFTREFAEGLAAVRDRHWYCDSTPRNVEVSAALAAALPDAVFVLTVRHYAGSILSLRQLPWFGSSWEDNARFWVDLNAAALGLPRERTIVVSYDALAAEPAPTLQALKSALQKHGFDTSTLDERVLAKSFAHVIGRPRPTIGRVENGGVRLQPIPSFDAERWSGDIHKAVWPIVKDMHEDLLRRLPNIYRCPPRPAELLCHDPSRGLVPLDDWGW